MTRRLSVLAAIAALFGMQKKASAQLPVQILIGPGKSFTIRFRGMERESLTSIITEFLANGKEVPKAKLDEILSTGGDITFVMTTSRD